MPAPHPVAYLNDALVPLKDARISPLDRGFLYADAVYEVVPVYDGRPFLLVEHCARLDRSLAAIGMVSPHDPAGWALILRSLIEAHVRETGSRWGTEILNDFRTYIGKFWLVKPKAAGLSMIAS